MSQSTLIVPKLVIIDIQLYDVTDVWKKPKGAMLVTGMLIGGGGGGGSGRKASTGTPHGGEGGCPGGAVYLNMLASLLDAEELVEVGTGGTGGAARASTANGITGTQGTYTAFAELYSAGGGRYGRGGLDLGPTTAFTAIDSLIDGGTSFKAEPSSVWDGVSSTIRQPAAGHVGAGDHGSALATFGVQGGNGVGTGGFNNSPGDPGTSTSGIEGGGGGGGGLFVGDAGGAGGNPGGGGGGGAYGNGSTNSGAGGNGGKGRAQIITWGIR